MSESETMITVNAHALPAMAHANCYSEVPKRLATALSSAGINIACSHSHLVLLIHGVDAVVVEERVRKSVLIRGHAAIRIHDPRSDRLCARLVAICADKKFWSV
jgi:hypothetical protein